MKPVIIFLLTIVFVSQKDIECDVYVNEDHEVIVLDENRISYRLKNKGGIITYSYFSGEYKKRKIKYKLGLDQGEYAEIQSTSVMSSQEEISKLCFYDRGLNPLKYAPVVFKSNENIIRQEYYIEDSGCVNVQTNFSVDSLDSQFEVQLLGNTFTQKLRLKKGKEYEVKLKVSPKYGIQNSRDYKRKCLKIESLGQGQVRVYDSIVKKWKVFKRSNEIGVCHDLIFNE